MPEEAFTLMVRVVFPVRPSLSMAVAVMVWVPTARLETEMLPPVPRTPLREEVQVMLVETSPSSVSEPVAVNEVGTPVVTVVAFAGAVIETVGGKLLGVETSREMVSFPLREPKSVAAAVMVWTPTEREEVVMLAPVPREPSMLEDQAMEAAMFPSSGSVAVPVKVTLEPGMAFEPSAGAVMVTTGALLGVPVMIKESSTEIESMLNEDEGKTLVFPKFAKPKPRRLNPAAGKFAPRIRFPAVVVPSVE